MKIVNNASAARDYAMLERNILAHLKLAVLLSVLSASLFLHAPPPSQIVEPPADAPNLQNASYPLSIALFVVGVLTALIGCGDYIFNYMNMTKRAAFLVASKPHSLTMAAVAMVVFVTCVFIVIQHS